MNGVYEEIGEVDNYEFSLEGRQWVTINVSGEVNSKIELFSGDSEAIVTTNWLDGDNSLRTRVLLFPGRYTLKVSPVFPDHTGEYSLEVNGESSGHRVLVVLHGMNSGPETWDAFVDAMEFESAPSIFDGNFVEDVAALPDPFGVYCYRVQFGSFDKISQRKGVGGIEFPVEETHLGGDFSSFDDLGREVSLAVNRIESEHGDNCEIILLGHSRGGIAARSFLQNADLQHSQRNIAGLVTVGTPHKGSQLARIYDYLDKEDNKQDEDTWEVVEFLRNLENVSFDLRFPTIGDLADTSNPIVALNRSWNQFPDGVALWMFSYEGVGLGILSRVPRYTVFDRGFGDLFPQVSEKAKQFLIGNRSPDDRTLSGDGIVTSQSQLSKFTVPGDRPLSRTVRSISNRNVTHTEEPDQVTDLKWAINGQIAWWP